MQSTNQNFDYTIKINEGIQQMKILFGINPP